MTPNYPKRPFFVTLLTLLVLSIAAIYIFGFFAALRHSAFLQNLPLSVPVWYLALRAILWSLTGLVLSWGLWRGLSWAWMGTQISVVGFSLYYWLDALLLAQAPGLEWRWPFELMATFLGLGFAFLVLHSAHGRGFFGK